MSYGIPNPYVATTHPWPTRFHGGLWNRPVFGYPRMTAVQSVFKPDDFNDGNPALRGLGEMQYDNGNGVFGTSASGGGVFGPSLYGVDGMGSVTTSTTVSGSAPGSCPMPDVCAQVQKSPAAKALMDMSLLDPFGNFGKYCADASYQAHITDKCQKAIASVLTGTNVATPDVVPGGTGSPLTKEAIKAVQATLNGALVNAGYLPLDVDGAVGKKMCGAIKWYRAQTGKMTAGAAYDAICSTKASIAPTKAGGGSKPGGGSPYQAPPVDKPETEASSMPSKATLAMIAGGVLAVGLAVVGKKKGWF